MIIIVIILILIALLILLNIIYKIQSIKNIVKKITIKLTKKDHNLQINKLNKNTYEFITSTDKYVFFIENIPTNTTIQINNKTTWEMKISNNSSTGASHQNSKILASIIKFMNFETDDKKIIIFTPDPKKIVMYINECEIIIVNSKTNVYGTNIILVNEIDKLK